MTETADQQQRDQRSGTAWYRLSDEQVAQELDVDIQQGLGSEEAAKRLAQYGPNALKEQGLTSPWQILWEQVTSTLVVILIVAAVVSAALGDFTDAVAILAIVALNALLGFRQEYRAERAIAALRKLSVPHVKVRRGGHVQEIGADEIVPGDVVLLEAGTLVPADGRLSDAANLRVEEAPLTGESQSVDKDAAALDGDPPLAERRNMAYMGTSVAYGRGLMIVTATGMQTELGAIATMIQQVVKETTPLQQRLDHLGKVLAAIALAIVAVIFILGLARSEDLKLMFLTAVSLAVAAVPEGLPAVVTIALALGAQRMLRRNALIRKLPAVETLGSVTTICSDKTGTLTRNEMTVTVLEVAGERIDLETPGSSADAGHNSLVPEEHPLMSLLLVGGALCNDAILESDEHGQRIVGDSTEGALVVAADRVGLSKALLEKETPRVAELPFEAVRKRMTTVHRLSDGRGDRPEWLKALPLEGQPHDGQPHDGQPHDGQPHDGQQSDGQRSDGPVFVSFTKGAVDSLLEIGNRVLTGEGTVPLDEPWRNRIDQAHERLADQGMRVLGLAYRVDVAPNGETPQPTEQELVIVGLFGMIDPPRSEVRDAVATCRTAGVRPMMITGDHPLTGRHIAAELGIDVEGGVVTGQQLDALDENQLDELVNTCSVYARVSPKHKLSLVKALQKQGQVVAMTGDGVNDAPALRQADIGVAMGITGTDVSKEAADMVLRDDNFATIVAAIEEGRMIFDNIRKFIKYLLSANAGEILVMLLAPFLGMPLPLLPLQILWINLVTDGPPALALGLEPAERGVMRRLPFPADESIFSRGVGIDILWIGLVTGISSLGLGYYFYSPDDQVWQTMIFTTLTFAQMALALTVRSQVDSFFRIGPFSNPAMLGAVVLTTALQLIAVYVPFMQSIFSTVPLSAAQLGLCVALGSFVFWTVELVKLVRRWRAPRVANEEKEESTPAKTGTNS